MGKNEQIEVTSRHSPVEYTRAIVYGTIYLLGFLVFIAGSIALLLHPRTFEMFFYETLTLFLLEIVLVVACGVTVGRKILHHHLHKPIFLESQQHGIGYYHPRYDRFGLLETPTIVDEENEPEEDKPPPSEFDIINMAKGGIPLRKIERETGVPYTRIRNIWEAWKSKFPG